MSQKVVNATLVGVWGPCAHLRLACLFVQTPPNRFPLCSFIMKHCSVATLISWPSRDTSPNEQTRYGVHQDHISQIGAPYAYSKHSQTVEQPYNKRCMRMAANFRVMTGQGLLNVQSH